MEAEPAECTELMKESFLTLEGGEDIDALKGVASADANGDTILS
jgi:hypothetical protein